MTQLPTGWTITKVITHSKEKLLRVHNEEYNKVCFVETIEDAMFFIELLEDHKNLCSLLWEASTIKARNTMTQLPTGGASRYYPDVVDWAVSRWQQEVENRPLQNVHRRTLDDTWRQVIRYAGGNDVVLLGPRHDQKAPTTRPASAE